MQYNELISAIAEQTNQPKKAVKKTLDALIERLKTELKQENSLIILPKFGKFQTKFAKTHNLKLLPTYNGVSDLVYKRIYFSSYRSTKKVINSKE